MSFIDRDDDRNVMSVRRPHLIRRLSWTPQELAFVLPHGMPEDGGVPVQELLKR
jgi:hypothetical protein